MFGLSLLKRKRPCKGDILAGLEVFLRFVWDRLYLSRMVETVYKNPPKPLKKSCRIEACPAYKFIYKEEGFPLL